MPGRPPKKASTVSSKLNSQNGSRRLRGVSTCALSPKQRPYSLCGSIRKMRRSGRSFENLRQQDGDAVRLADAGGAEHGEVLADELLDVDLRRDRMVLLQGADVRRLGGGAVVDQPQLAIAHQHRGLADHRIFGDAALEVGGAGGVGLDLANQVDPRRAAASRDPGRAAAARRFR